MFSPQFFKTSLSNVSVFNLSYSDVMLTAVHSIAAGLMLVCCSRFSVTPSDLEQSSKTHGKAARTQKSF